MEVLLEAVKAAELIQGLCGDFMVSEEKKMMTLLQNGATVNWICRQYLAKGYAVPTELL